MAFTAAEKDSLMGYLAWDVTPDSITQFNSAIAKVEAVPSAETRVRGYLTKISAIETQIDTARNTAGSPYDQLLSEAQRLVYMVGNTLGLEVKRKVFS